jgi:hypothetical protein
MRVRPSGPAHGRRARGEVPRTPLLEIAAALSALVLVVACIGPEAGPRPLVDDAAGSQVSSATTATTVEDSLRLDPTAFRPLPAAPVLTSATIGPSAAVTVTLPGVPTGARAALLNVTTLRSTETTRISACAGPVATEACTRTTGLVATPDGTGSSMLVAPLGGPRGDETSLVNLAGDVTVTADLAGFFLPSTSAEPDRDTLLRPVASRTVAAGLDVAPGPGTVVDLPDVPTGATAVMLDVAASGTLSPTVLSVCPQGQPDAECAATTTLSAGSGEVRRNLVVVPLGGPRVSQIVLRSSQASATATLDVQGYFVSGAPTGTGGRVYPLDGIDLLPWQGVAADEDVTVTLPDLPDGALAATVRVTGTSGDRATSLSLCPGSDADGSCSRTQVVPVGLDRMASNNALIPLDPNDPDHLTLRAAGASATVRVELRGYVVADATSADVIFDSRTANLLPAATPPAAAGDPGSSPAPSAGPSAAPTPTSAPPAAPPAPPPARTGKPGPTNTGVPAGTNLTVHQGNLYISTPGTVIDSMEIRGFVRILAPNITIRNSKILGGTATYSIGLVMNVTPGASVVIEDSEIYAAQPSSYISGVMGGNFTLRRVNLHDVIDQTHIYGDNVRIESSWFHNNLHYANDPMHAGGPSHDDNIQIQKGTNIRIIGNTLEGAWNAGFIITQDQDVVSDVQYLRNWADGGGCTVNIAEKGRGPIQGLIVNDNRFGTHTRIPDCAVITPPTTPLIAEGNVWDATGLPARIRRNGQ